MRFVRTMLLIAGMTTALTPFATQAQQVPGPHPAYLHALTDLRAARHYLNDGWAWGPAKQEDDAAIHEINAAIDEIKKAAIDDGKGLNDPFPIDAHLKPQDRFKKALDLLNAAHIDLSRAEDVPQARGLRNRAIVHADHAHVIVSDAIHNARWQ